MQARWLSVAMTVAAMVASVAGHAEPAPDPRHILTIQLENDGTNPGSDRYYTNGLRIAYTSPTDRVPGFLADFGHALLGPGQQRYGLELSQLIFTPTNTGVLDPSPTDRPYAGLLIGTLSLIHDTDHVRTTLALGVGVIGPLSLAQESQDFAHSVQGNRKSQGFNTQIPNQPVIQLTAERTWRMPVGAVGDMETDVLPAVAAGLGTFRIYGQAGGYIRFGQGLDSDFGAPRIRPGLGGADAYHATRPVAWYVFLGGNGQLVGWDETLDGTPFGASRNVTRKPVVAEAQAGVVVMAWGWRFTAAHVVRSREFTRQSGGVFQFSSFSVSTKF